MAVNTLRLLVATLKGGPGKTTTTILLATALARRGDQVAVICADTRSRGSTDWIQEAERKNYPVPFKLAIWHETDGPLSSFARKVEAATGADVVIVDTGGEQPDTFAHGCMYADVLISPVGPQEGELRRIVETYNHATAVHESGSQLDLRILLTRCPVTKRGKAKQAREDLEHDGRTPEGELDPDKPFQLGLQVLDTEITRSVAYDEFWGTIPDELGEYDDLAVEVGTLPRDGQHGAA